MEQIRICFFDIDGTLIDPATGRISQGTRQALTQLRRRGILCCVVTGRPPASLPDFGDLVFDAIAAFNGAVCYTQSQVIRSTPICPRELQQLLENAAALGRPVSLALKDRLAANGLDPDLADYYALADLELTVAEDFPEACREPVYQVMLGCREADLPAILRGTRQVKIARSWDRAVDVIPLESGKGPAIQSILAHFGLQPQEAMAFGDSFNDLDMLQAVGTGVAMGNAVEPLKALAHYVCPPVSREGIYRFCLEQGLL